MRSFRNLFLSLVSFFVFLYSFDTAAADMIIPITVGDVQNFQKMNFSDKASFVFDFYSKNKKAGMTDTEIINELLKLDEKGAKTDALLKVMSYLGNRFESMEDFFKAAVAKINQDILQRYPSRFDLLVDINKPETWKNLQYLTVGKNTIKEYLEKLTASNYLSDTIVTKYGAFAINACADRGNGQPITVAFVVMPREGYSFIQQTGGNPKTPIEADFSNSENLVISSLSYPLEDSFTVRNLDVYGYRKLTYLPFLVTVKDASVPAIIRAKLKLTSCFNNVCTRETVPEITYKVYLSEHLESPSCSALQIIRVNVPENGQADFNVLNAFFKKTNDGEVNLFVKVKTPFLGGTVPVFHVRNEVGLNFSKPFITDDGNTQILKIRLLNPEKLVHENVRLTFEFAMNNRSSAIQKDVGFSHSFLSFTSFSVVDFFASFFLGLKFLLMTPLLSVLLIFVYQMLFNPEKSAEDSYEFFNGISKSFYVFAFIYVLLIVLFFFVLPSGLLYWGIQFFSPMINFVFVIIFLLAILGLYNSLRDEDSVVATEKSDNLTDLFGLLSVREKTGFLVGVVAASLLVISPMIGLYYDIYSLLMKSPILYPVAFVSGLILPFIFCVRFVERAEEIPSEQELAKNFRYILSVPLGLQIVFLLFIIAAQSGIWMALEAVALLGIGIYAYKKFAVCKLVYVVASLLIIAVFALPLMPNEYNMNKMGAVEFNEVLLRDEVKRGNVVYLNVTEDFCLSCHWSRVMMMYGGAQAIRDGRLTIMGIDYKNDFLRHLFLNNRARVLPMNLMFSNKNPEGKMLPAVLGPWRSKDIVNEALSDPTVKKAPLFPLK